jgi:GNAT superfamily N-acetyltransferase
MSAIPEEQKQEQEKRTPPARRMSSTFNHPQSSILVRPLRPDEADEACALARAVFDQFIAAGQEEKGRRMFHRFAQPAALLQRHATRYTSWVAVDGPRVVGLLHIHARNHVSLLFVAPEYQGRGCAGQLLRTASASGELVAPVTVNASPNAVDFYTKAGFAPDGPQLLRNGVRFQPMRCVGPLR